jgi:hypothetical protein
VSVEQRDGKTRPRLAWPRSPVSYASGKTVSVKATCPELKIASILASLR